MGRLLLLVGLVLLAVACGGGSTSTVTTAVTVVETQPAPATATEQPTPTVDTTNPALRSRRFQMPSKNIGCQTGEGVLVCDILSGLGCDLGQGYLWARPAPIDDFEKAVAQHRAERAG